jgi:nucleoside-diphosphate-sugar epimerase
MLAVFKLVGFGIAPRLADFKEMSFVYGPDAAEACVRALETDVPSGSSYFVTDGESYTFDQMIDAMSKSLGVETWARPQVPRFVLKAAAAVTERVGKAMDRAVMFNSDKVNEVSIENFAFDIAPTIEELGWSPTTRFEEGARNTVEWYRQNGWL